MTHVPVTILAIDSPTPLGTWTIMVVKGKVNTLTFCLRKTDQMCVAATLLKESVLLSVSYTNSNSSRNMVWWYSIVCRHIATFIIEKPRQRSCHFICAFFNISIAYPSFISADIMTTIHEEINCSARGKVFSIVECLDRITQKVFL